MPVVKHLMDSLQKKYGKKKGTQVYYAMENKGSKSFKKAVKTAKSEGKGHTSTNLKAYEKSHNRNTHHG